MFIYTGLIIGSYYLMNNCGSGSGSLIRTPIKAFEGTRAIEIQGRIFPLSPETSSSCLYTKDHDDAQMKELKKLGIKFCDDDRKSLRKNIDIINLDYKISLKFNNYNKEIEYHSLNIKDIINKNIDNIQSINLNDKKFKNKIINDINNYLFNNNIPEKVIEVFITDIRITRC